ncbi:GTP-binding protein [Galdieria sulphuraria]|uniref:GTP-binding protein n=1 Tax=Galdieria sulphuraria TaxID=130081 RepID=M2W2H6_GALSU|nr:GTP-binding protein [Galdieria sulphuraria]EME29886.1 GTP-binding protein [Galdieria sulphuraria]|eukprot:XP_005706406.1 GTP-binding protein [Galdieria sulphuraria]
MECKLIDREGTFSGHLPLSNKTLPCRNYVTLAIIGCQSSGKSTLFNELFETKFPVLDAKKNGRQRTTLGIWSTTKNVDQLQNKESSSERGCSRQLVLLDVEGTDSRERQEPTKTFDLCTTLFCLTVADVILVNLWFRDVGRHQASNADLYASVFSTTLKWKEIEGLDVMRKKHLKTRLLIVIRDFEEVEASEDQVKWFISQDFRNIWKTVEKPKSLEDTVMEDIFILSFHFLPNVKYRKDEFVSSVSKLRERILHDDDSWSSSITDSLWKKEIPLQILEMFLKESWDLIKQRQGLNNDLNNISYFDLNTHKKCSFYLEQSWNEYKLMLIEFQRTVERNYSKPIEEFSKVANSLYNECLACYDRMAASFRNTSSYQLKRKLLGVKLTSELLEVRKFQIWAYRDQILHSFEIEFAPMIGAVGNFKKNAGNLVKRKVKDFQKCLEKCRVPGMLKEEELNDLQDLERTLRDQVQDRSREGELMFPMGLSSGNTSYSRRSTPWWKELLIKAFILYLQYLQSKANKRTQRKKMQNQERILPKGPTF